MRLLVLATLVLAAPLAAQTLGTSGVGSPLSRGGSAAGSLPGVGTGGAGSLSGGGVLGRPPAALGSTTTLGDQIDASAGLDTMRARGGLSAPSSSRGSGGVATGLSSPRALDNAGQPAGTPFGTSPN